MNRAENAYSIMADSKMNCAQFVLTAFCEELGLDRATALKMARGFGGGMGRTGKTCGAVTGAYMVIGLAEKLADREGIDAVYALIKEFNREFTELHGSLECSTLLGCDLSTADGQAKARSESMFTKVCPNFVKDAVTILEMTRT